VEHADVTTVARWRLSALGLAPAAYPSPTAVVNDLVATQAQDLLPGRWSLAQRCAKVPAEPDVARRHDAGDFVRTHTLRPTWHFVATADLAMVLAATSGRVKQQMAYMNRQVGVDDALMAEARPVIERRLAAGPATRDELGSALAESGIEAAGVRLAHVVMWAELEGWIGSGPSRGRQQTYRLLPTLDHWDESEARAELARSYLRTRGPATERDFATWASLTLTQARKAIEAAGPARLEVGGRTFLYSAPPPAVQVPPDSPVVSMLQAYDELVMSYSDSRDVLTGEQQLWDLPDRTYMHPLAVDGRLVGHWRYDRDGAGRPERVTTRLLRPLTQEERQALDLEVSRFAAFAGREVRWLG
jgi:hypothetical protein